MGWMFATQLRLVYEKARIQYLALPRKAKKNARGFMRDLKALTGE